jgi:catechol 2,3-dioxygenase-like lactoylglutathione lyase family enzyme
MLTGIDHVAIVVRDLDAAIAAWEQRGFAPVRGGRHPNGSINAFVSFPDGSVIELFGFEDASKPNEHRYWQSLQRGEGPCDWCFSTDDLTGDLQRYRAAGFAIGEPIARSRVRPDGMELRWRVAITEGADRGVVPFLIQDETPRADRIPPARVQPNRCKGVAFVEIGIHDRTYGDRVVAMIGQESFPIPTQWIVDSEPGLRKILLEGHGQVARGHIAP